MPDETAALRTALRQFLGVGDESPPYVLGLDDSVQDAYDDGHDTLLITTEYDCPDDATLTIPEDRTLTLVGSGVELGHSLTINGSGVPSYAHAPTIRGVNIRGGGLQLVDTPYAQIQNVIVEDSPGHGFTVDPGPTGAYGMRFSGCQAWHCEENGFNLDRGAEPHGVVMDGCHAIANRGMGARVRGSNWSFINGSLQLNHEYGLECRGGDAGYLGNTYVEGNDRAEPDVPIEVFVKNHAGLSVMHNRFHGISPRDDAHGGRVRRGINAHDTHLITFANRWQRYSEVGVKTFDCETALFPATQSTFECEFTD